MARWYLLSLLLAVCGGCSPGHLRTSPDSSASAARPAKDAAQPRGDQTVAALPTFDISAARDVGSIADGAAGDEDTPRTEPPSDGQAPLPDAGLDPEPATQGAGVVYAMDLSSIDLNIVDPFLDHQGHPIDGNVRGLSPSLATSIFNDKTGNVNSALGPETNSSYTHHGAHIVHFPGRGKVLRTYRDPNGIRGTDGDNPPAGGLNLRVNSAHPDSGSWTEAWAYVEIFTPATNPFTGEPPVIAKARKLPAALYGGSLKFEGQRYPGDPQYAGAPWYSEDDGWNGRLTMVFKKGYPNKPDWFPTDYIYTRVPPCKQCTSLNMVQSLYQDNSWPLEEIAFVPGTWHKMMFYAKVNSAPGVTDGKLRAWVGVVGGRWYRIAKRNGVDMSSVAGKRNKIEGIFWLAGYGGNHVSFEIPEDQVTYWANLTMRVTPPADIPQSDITD